MTGPPPPECDLDPFERRLATRLEQRATTITADPDGLHAIRARIGQRRRRRHFVVGIGSLVVLVVLVAGLLDLTRSRHDTAVVDAGENTMPFLGFANDTWDVVASVPDTSYVVVDSMDGPSDEVMAHLLNKNKKARA
jgi:hypothetical protein